MAAAAAEAIESAVNTLAAHPLVGRRVEDDLRELVISFGATGYIALYRFVVQDDQVRVLAVRHAAGNRLSAVAEFSASRYFQCGMLAARRARNAR